LFLAKKFIAEAKKFLFLAKKFLAEAKKFLAEAKNFYFFLEFPLKNSGELANDLN
jgi:hypothetical protein